MVSTTGDVSFVVLIILLPAAIFILWLWSVDRVYWDAERRGWPGFWVALAVFASWPWGWILYSIQRRRDDARKANAAASPDNAPSPPES
ncbi:MAG: hypothetical protein JSV65_12210 [Armatimonadota bacterium]|nr:MAG: hypothetical protein JSV65_12210 [Armatimonadota bacterium]